MDNNELKIGEDVEAPMTEKEWFEVIRRRVSDDLSKDKNFVTLETFKQSGVIVGSLWACRVMGEVSATEKLPATVNEVRQRLFQELAKNSLFTNMPDWYKVTIKLGTTQAVLSFFDLVLENQKAKT